MNNGKTHQDIWNPETGITDIGPDPEDMSASEIPGIRAVWTEQREQLKETEQLSEFTEKLSREWAIETGVIENLYDIERGVTETLIAEGFKAELLEHGSTNKPREYVIQLLNDQKEALEGIFDFVKGRRDLSTSYIKELHSTLLRNQEVTEAIDSQGHRTEVHIIKGDWKMQPNHPMRDGVEYRYCLPEHVGSEMDRLVEIHADHIKEKVSPEVQAAWLHHRFTQIHPFQDGNGRVARAITSIVLIKNGLFPLVVTRDDRSRYLDALEAADHNDLKPLIDLIARLQIIQFRKASALSEYILAGEGDVETALDGLDKTASMAAVKRRKLLEKVFDLAVGLEKSIESSLEGIKERVEGSLGKVANRAANVRIKRSDSDIDHYYRHQIVWNAKERLGYFANTAEYRSWVALLMRWNGQRQARLVFTIHGIGRPFNGSLICAPFLEFKDIDDENESRTALVPVTDEGFVFFYQEDQDRLLARFRPWRDNVVKVALEELGRNLW